MARALSARDAAARLARNGPNAWIIREMPVWGRLPKLLRGWEALSQARLRIAFRAAGQFVPRSYAHSRE